LKTRCTTLVPMPSFRSILRMPSPLAFNSIAADFMIADYSAAPITLLASRFDLCSMDR
jgi:hypothetical protein